MKEFMWKSQSINPFRLALYMKVRTQLQMWLFVAEKYNNAALILQPLMMIG